MNEQDDSTADTKRIETDGTELRTQTVQRRRLLQILGAIGGVGSTAHGVGGVAAQPENSAIRQRSIVPQVTGDWTQRTKLFADDGDGDEAFGRSVALDGEYALIGASGQGSAYVFRRSDGVWTQRAKLVADDGDNSSRFGRSVSLDDGIALIGDPSDTGSAYVFSRSDDTWTQETKLTADDGDEGDKFGASVSLDSGIALIGASRDTVSGDTELGSAYVFERSNGTWTQQAKLVADEQSFQSEWFGTSVALDGETALIGAPVDYDSEVGSAYVFRRTDGAWIQQERLVTDEAYLDRRFDRFGSSVALDDGTALVGSAGYNGEAGSAYVFRRSDGTWTQQAELVDDDLVTGDQFGGSVALDGETACVGGEAMGAAYVFRRSDDSWTREAELVIDDSDRVSTWVTLDGRTVCIGTPEDENPNGDVTGSAYVFDGSPDAPAIPPVGDFDNPPTDPDGDGLYEDINGDGRFDLVDVQALFANLDDETIQNNPEAFDFNDDGNVDIVDVQRLFTKLQN